MGIFDKAKDAISDAVESHPDQVSDALDKAEGIVDEKTGGKFTDQISGGVDKAKDALGINE